MDHKAQLKAIMAKMKGNYSKLELQVRNFPNLHSVIMQSWPHQHVPKNFIERCYVFLTNESPICSQGKHRRFEYFRTGYVSCGKACACAREKHAQTMIERHGTPHALQSPDIKEKFKQTLLNRYNADNLNLAFRYEREQTNLSRYGYKTPLESLEIRTKIETSCFNSLGVSHPFRNHAIQQKIQKHWQEVNPNGQKSYVRDAQDGQLARLRYSELHFNDSDQILSSASKLAEMLRKYSRVELSNRLNCSLSLIDARIVEFDLTEFQNKLSYYEILIQALLDEHQIEYVRNTRKIIPPMELDFYLPAYKFAIEFCGLRWHSERAGRGKTYHVDKFNKCSTTGIKLIQIFQDEWDTNSHIVKSIICRNIGIVGKPINARQCTIVDLNQSETNEFLKTNHLQGPSIGTSVRKGLKYNEELLAVMTFDKIKGWEIKRFAVKTGYNIRGAASKLFYHFVKEYAPSEVFSYSDLRYFTGEVYASLGFKNIYTTLPGFFYTKGVKRYNRLNFTKKKLVKLGYDLTKTGDQIMQELGYDKIWDCGNNKWVWRT
jgi:hypothetical protein